MISSLSMRQQSCYVVHYDQHETSVQSYKLSYKLSYNVTYTLTTKAGSKYTLRTHLLRLVMPDDFHASSGAGRGSAQTSFVYTHPSVIH